MKTFTHYIFLLLLFLLSGTKVFAQGDWNDGIRVKNALVIKKQSNVHVKLSIVFTKQFKLSSNESLILTPVLVKNRDSLSLPQVAIEGKKQRIFAERNKLKRKFYALRLYKKEKEQTVEYLYNFPYKQWMNGAAIEILLGECKCCKLLPAGKKEFCSLKIDPTPFKPLLAYVRPEATSKKAEIEGSAYLTFNQGKTVVVPELGKNADELEKIYKISKDIEADNQAKVDGITFHGYASPEGSYKLNATLAQNRVLALKKYVERTFKWSSLIIFTESTPENWKDLRRMVDESELPHKTEILELIDSDKDPDVKEKKIKSAYPKDYAHMLSEFYPLLRRTDYNIRYTIRSYTVEEAKMLLKTQPSLLNLNEMYLVAQTYKPGTADFNEVFDVAVRLFPNDEVANLNAANVALAKGDLPTATRYLNKITRDSGEVLNAKGVKAMLDGDYSNATRLLKAASDKGIAVAKENIRQIEQRIAEEQ